MLNSASILNIDMDVILAGTSLWLSGWNENIAWCFTEINNNHHRTFTLDRWEKNILSDICSTQPIGDIWTWSSLAEPNKAVNCC